MNKFLSLLLFIFLIHTTSVAQSVSGNDIWKGDMPDSDIPGPKQSTSVTPLSVVKAGTSLVSVSGAFADQQYTSISIGSQPTINAMEFGIKDVSSSSKKWGVTAVGINFDDIGTPDASYYTSPGDGISTFSNGAFNISVAAEGLSNTTDATDGQHYVGQIVYTFTKPVDYPILHVGGIGAIFDAPELGASLVWHTQYEATGYTLTKLSGTPQTVLSGGTLISNSWTTDNYIESSNSNAYGTDGDLAASGSFRVNGKNIETFTMNVYIKGTKPNQAWHVTGNTATKVFNNDRHSQSWTVETFDFCGKVVIDTEQNGVVSGSDYTSSQGAALNAVLVDGAGNVVAVSPTSSTDGTFCFENVLGDDYKVLLRTDSPTIGQPAPTESSLGTNIIGEQYYSIEEQFVDGVTQASYTNAYEVSAANISNVTTSNLILGISTTNPQSPSPVTYTSFKAENKGAYNELSWETSSEENNKGYFVERSVDGKLFVELGFVEGNGSTKEAVSYRFVDEKPSSDNYYRLRQVDHDGKSTISEIRYVRVDGLNRRISVYPNPFVDGLTIETGNYDDAIIVEVMNATGRLVIQHKTTERYIDLSNAKTGAYIVSVKSSKGELLLQKKVVKIH